jgi:hypothetical protein
MPPSKRPTAVRDIIKFQDMCQQMGYEPLIKRYEFSIDKPMRKAILFDNNEHQKLRNRKKNSVA